MLVIDVIKEFGFNSVSFLSIKAHNISCNDTKIIKFKEKYSIIENKFNNIFSKTKTKSEINDRVSLKDLIFAIKIYNINLIFAIKLHNIAVKYWNYTWIDKWINCELSRRKNYNYSCNLDINQFYNIWNQVSEEFLEHLKNH